MKKGNDLLKRFQERFQPFPRIFLVDMIASDLDQLDDTDDLYFDGHRPSGLFSVEDEVENDYKKLDVTAQDVQKKIDKTKAMHNLDTIARHHNTSQLITLTSLEDGRNEKGESRLITAFINELNQKIQKKEQLPIKLSDLLQDIQQRYLRALSTEYTIDIQSINYSFRFASNFTLEFNQYQS